MIKPSKTIAEKVLEQLEKDILSGVYKPGDRLIEGELASLMGVSRGPVREALLILTRRGLVKEKKGNAKGREITSINTKDIKEYYQIRTFLETQCLVDIARQDDKSALVPLFEMQKRMNVLSKQGDLENYITANTELHHNIVKSAGNDKLYKVYSDNDLMIRWFRGVTLTRERMLKSNEEHGQILDLCLKGNLSDLIPTVYKHQAQAMKRVIEQYILKSN
jgi:DNA-binding GntR family transcriptional regulator